jgi:hypothetical protein
MSKPARLECAHAEAPTVKSCPVLGETAGRAPSRLPCVTSDPVAASIAKFVVIFSFCLLYV